MVALAALVLALLSSPDAVQGQTDRPNVLFIAIDDLNDWTGALEGNLQARTPHMDKLASKGMVFTNAHCAAPACGPSRSALMTGMRPSTSGNYVNQNSFTKNPILNRSVLLTELLQQNGYYVAGSGKLFHGAHFKNEVQGRGFDEAHSTMKCNSGWSALGARPAVSRQAEGRGECRVAPPRSPDRPALALRRSSSVGFSRVRRELAEGDDFARSLTGHQLRARDLP